SSVPGMGYLLWPLALLPLFFRSTRRFALLLWASLLLWTALVSLNGQVRWQNARYSMPALAWVLLSAALGVGATFARLKEAKLRWAAYAGSLSVVLALGGFLFGQSERFREQVWFFGRASRNILEQHIRSGYYLGAQSPRLTRILLSDAGALPYDSGLPAFDLIGLGGYASLPIAKASRQGVGAAVELIEHLPESTRPDVIATYPSWWGEFILYFGRPIRDFGVRGNVICGGASMVIYAPDWSPLQGSSTPFSLRPSERLIDTLDVADLLSEEAHHFSLAPQPAGYVSMKILDNPADTTRGLWDAGRLLSPGHQLNFELSDFRGAPADLILRIAPAEATELVLHFKDQERIVAVEAQDNWQEIRIPLGTQLGSQPFSLEVRKAGVVLHHIFAVAPTSQGAAP
ncbi:MAG: hypothetical protein MK135_17100, partial [Polyangiaceae bacterium]|nr:hypothetical protein [Polyangiaceae bacterium]